MKSGAIIHRDRARKTAKGLHSLSLHKFDEAVQPDAADLEILPHGILGTVFVLLQGPLTLLGPQYLKAHPIEIYIFAEISMFRSLADWPLTLNVFEVLSAVVNQL